MKPSSSIWLYGIHTCQMVLNNPRRQVMAICALPGTITKVLPNATKLNVKEVDRKHLESLLPPGAVHQGIAIQVAPLPSVHILDLQKDSSPHQCVIVLDQVSDPHNVGAILRSAAVLGAKAVILTDRHAPPESGTLAKSASGALELVPLIRVTNLAQGLKDLKNIGFWCVGLTESGEQRLDQIDLKGKIALILGAEGDGMRRLTKDLCDFTASLPSATAFSTLNVSNAAAIALYEIFCVQKAL